MYLNSIINFEVYTYAFISLCLALPPLRFLDGGVYILNTIFLKAGFYSLYFNFESNLYL